MKNFICFMGLLLLASGAFAQKNQSPVNGWPAGITHDFGAIRQNVAADYSFEFSNNTQEPVTIISARPACNCMTAAYTQTAIEPGEKGTIIITYNAHTPGKFSKTITVALSNGETTILNISGEVVQ